MKGGKHRLNLWKDGLAKELECLQCLSPQRDREGKGFLYKEFKLSLFRREVLILVPQAISQACVLVKGECSFPSCAGMPKGI